METSAFLEIRGVRKTYKTRGKSYEVLDEINLRIRQGEFVSLIGPSGCGKSTLLNLIAGLERCDVGDILLEGVPIEGPGADRGMVFQNYALFPWMTVFENIMFALDCVMKGMEKKEKEALAMKYIDMVKLTAAKDKKPTEISGGMKQRVGIARAFAVNPKILLLDEPFGALDALTRGSLQDELERIWEKDRRTVIMVTHDIEEAILLSDRIIVMSQGPKAKIMDILAVDLPRPRDRSNVMERAGFVTLRKSLIRMLADEQDE